MKKTTGSNTLLTMGQDVFDLDDVVSILPYGEFPPGEYPTDECPAERYSLKLRHGGKVLLSYQERGAILRLLKERGRMFN